MPFHSYFLGWLMRRVNPLLSKFQEGAKRFACYSLRLRSILKNNSGSQRLMYDINNSLWTSHKDNAL